MSSRRQYRGSWRLARKPVAIRSNRAESAEFARRRRARGRTLTPKRGD